MAYFSIPFLLSLFAGLAHGTGTAQGTGSTQGDGSPAPQSAGGTLPSSASQAESAPESAQGTGVPVARITDPLGTFEITAEDYFGRLTRRVGEQLLPHYARRLRLEAEAQRLGIEVRRAELREAFEEERRERIDRAFGGDETLYDAEIRRAGRTVEGHRTQRLEELRERMLAERIALRLRVVGDSDLEEHYALRYGFRGHRFEGRVLSLPWVQPTTPAGTPQEEAQRLREASRLAALQRIEAIRTEIRGGLEFSEAVGRYVEDPGIRERGGRLLGEFPPPRWPEHVFEDLVELELGTVSDPFFARGSFHLVWLDGRTFTGIEDVRDQLRTELENRPVDAEELQTTLAQVTMGLAVEPTEALFGTGTDPADVIATLDRESIQRGPFVEWMARRYGEDQFGTLIQAWIVERAAADRGLEVTAAEVEARLDREIEFRIEMFHRGDRERWLEGIERQGLSLESYRRYQASLERIHMLIERIILDERGVGEEEVLEHFEQKYGPGGREVRVRMLQLDVEIPELPPGLEPAERERRIQGATDATVRRAAAFVERVREDGEDFASLIRNHSDDPASAPQGGIPPGDFRTLEQPRQVRAALASLGVGGLSDPVVVGRSVFVYEVLGEQRTEFESVRGALRHELEHRRLPETERAGALNLMMRSTEYETLPALYGG